MSGRPESDGGFVLIYRRLLDHPIFRDQSEAMMFAWLVLQAAWKPVKVRYKGRPVDLKRGQLAISVRDFADKFARSKGWAERFINRLQAESMIGTESGTGTIVISIINYDTYQRSSQVGGAMMGQPPGHGRDSIGTQNKADKELKEEERDSADAGPAQPAAEAEFALAATPAGSVKPITHSTIEAFALWNIFAARCGWRKVAKLTDHRRDKLRLRLREVGGLPGWEAALGRAEASEVLGRIDHPTWWDFDFLVHNDTNIQKLLDGKYDRRSISKGGFAGPPSRYSSRMRDPVLEDIIRGIGAEMVGS